MGDLEELDVLDLFSGVGSLGLESLSRGASRASFVESDRVVLRYLRRNIRDFGLEETTRVYALNVYDYLAELESNRASYHVVFADPPYDRGDIGRLADRYAPGGDSDPESFEEGR
jgi:16S rRNA (guanine966-N2)-methyltransferase